MDESDQRIKLLITKQIKKQCSKEQEWLAQQELSRKQEIAEIEADCHFWVIAKQESETHALQIEKHESLHEQANQEKMKRRAERAELRELEK